VRNKRQLGGVERYEGGDDTEKTSLVMRQREAALNSRRYYVVNNVIRYSWLYTTDR